MPFDLGVLQFSVKTQPSTETISSHRVSFKRQSDTITCVSTTTVTSFNFSSQLIHSEAANFFHNLWRLAKFFSWQPTSSTWSSQLLQFDTANFCNLWHPAKIFAWSWTWSWKATSSMRSSQFLPFNTANFCNLWHPAKIFAWTWSWSSQLFQLDAAKLLQSVASNQIFCLKRLTYSTRRSPLLQLEAVNFFIWTNNFYNLRQPARLSAWNL